MKKAFMKKALGKLALLLMVTMLALSVTGCATGTIYGKPLDEAEEMDKNQAILFMNKIKEAMQADDLDAINQLGYHYGQADAETFEAFWEEWQAYREVYGQITGIRLEEAYQYGNEKVFVFEGIMEKGSVHLSSMYTDDFDLVMLFIYETEEEDLRRTAMPEGVKEVDVTIGEGTDYPLAAKITMPKQVEEGQKLPAVVLVGGDGNNNMDYHSGGVYMYRDIAWGLAQNGIVSIRFDKRLHTYSDLVTAENAPAEYFTVDWEYVEDALLATQMLRDQAFVDAEKVYYVGHSQGAIVAPRVDEAGGNYAGIVMLSSSPRPWYEVIYDQFINYGLVDRNDEEIYYLVSKMNVERDFIAEGDYLEEEEDKATTTFLLTRPIAFWKDYLSYDYVGNLKNAQKPLLILHGDANFQIKKEVDFARWEQELAGCNYATLKSYEGLNYLFTPSQGVFAGHYKEFEMPARVSQQMIQDVSQWILQGSINQ